MQAIPNPVVAVVSEELASVNTHASLDVLFAANGAPGDPPPGNKVVKCMAWFRLVNGEHRLDKTKFLGGLLQNFIEVDPVTEFEPGTRRKARERVVATLAKCELSYLTGGTIIGVNAAIPSQTLEQVLRARDMGSVQKEFTRSLQAVETDPAATVTAACAILEALCKTYIHDENLDLPKDMSIKPLWSVVQKHLGLDPASVEDDDLKRILSGLSSVVDGLGAFRTHVGSAHGRGRKSYNLKPRHARLVAHAAHTLTVFVLETWEARKGGTHSNHTFQ